MNRNTEQNPNLEPLLMSADELLSQKCSNPDCKHAICSGEPFFIHSKCHPMGALESMVNGKLITMLCAVCGRPVVSFLVE